jgi:DNA-binding MarR family transcriptional regulator
MEQSDNTSESNFSPPDVEILQNKGAIFILMSLGISDNGQTFTDIREKSHLSNGTTQRRIEELQEAGWIQMEPTTNKNGKAVKKYFLSEQAQGMIDGFKELGKALLK